MVESASSESIRSAYIQGRTIAHMQEVTADRISKPKLREGRIEENYNAGTVSNSSMSVKKASGIV